MGMARERVGNTRNFLEQKKRPLKVSLTSGVSTNESFELYDSALELFDFLVEQLQHILELGLCDLATSSFFRVRKGLPCLRALSKGLTKFSKLRLTQLAD